MRTGMKVADHMRRLSQMSLFDMRPLFPACRLLSSYYIRLLSLHFKVGQPCTMHHRAECVECTSSIGMSAACSD